MVTKSYDIEHRLRQIVFQRTREWLAGGRKLNALAAKAGVRAATVSKLAYGETKYPRLHTVIAVCDALGVQIMISGGTENINVVPMVGKQK